LIKKFEGIILKLSLLEKNIMEDNNNKNVIINNNPSDNYKDDSNKCIFTSLPLKLESEGNNNIYTSFLIKELLKYNLQNIFNIINQKKIIINSKVYYQIKKYAQKRIFLLIKSEILYIKISSSVFLLSVIFMKNRANKLYQVLYKINSRNKTNNHMFKIKYEIKFKNEKDNIINENSIKLKKLEKEVNEMENNIKILNLRDSELKLKLTNLSKKEKQLNDTIKQFESTKSIVSHNKNTINSNSIYESDIISLESTIVNNKQQREEKEKIINNFIFNVNELLNEYQEYIDILNNKKSRNNINNSNYVFNNSNSNDISNSTQKRDESYNTFHSSKNNSIKPKKDIYQERYMCKEDNN